MAQEKLIEVGLENLAQGLYPSAEPTAGQVWSNGSNMWFRDLSVEQILGNAKILNITGRPPRALAQALNSPTKSLYYESFGIVYQMNGTGNPTVFTPPVGIVGLADSPDYWLEPWGTWLAVTDNMTQPQLWQGGPIVPIGVGQFKTAKIFKKIAQFLVAYNTDVLPNGFHWSGVSDPTLWTPSPVNAARNLQIRDLDSEIVCVADLGAFHAVYSRDTMLLVQYVGPDEGWLGTPNQALRGIGAVSKHSVVALGR